MSTPRLYKIDVIKDCGCCVNGWHALIRRNPGVLPPPWCRHYVKATSNDGAQAKAIAEHRANCEETTP